MSLHLPFKLLEITVRSAQDLPPVSKLLRTYAVAWVQPDHKCSTRVDRRGHTNPTWNDKFVFRVDDKFLTADTSAVTIEIYSISWLRDIPIGTVCVPINDLLPPSSWFKLNSTTRFVNLQVTRPSGHLQGVLNIGINLLSSTSRSMPLSSELCVATDQKTTEKQTNHQHKKAVERSSSIKLQRSQSQKTVSFKDEVVVQESTATNGSIIADGWEPNCKATNGSVCSYIRPLPSEVAAALAKGLYSTSGDDVGSSIFENWTVASVRVEMPKPKVVRWTEDITPQKTGDKKHSRWNSGGGKRRGGGGLLSCFGIVCGYECNIFCGKPKSGKKNKKKKKKKRYEKRNGGHAGHADETLHRFYINS